MSFEHISIFVADHSDVVLAGFKAVLSQYGVQKVYESNTSEGLAAKVAERQPSILFLFWNLPNLHARQIVRDLRTLAPNTKIIVTLQEESDFGDAIHAEADGYISRNTREFVLPAAIESIVTIGSWIGPNIAKYLTKGEGRTLFRSPVSLDSVIVRRLTPKERQIAQLLAAGWDNAAIGSYLTVTEDTVRVHIKNIGEKVGALGREAVRNRLLARTKRE